MYPGIGDQKLKPVLTEKINQAATDFEVLAERGIASDKDYQNAIKKGLSRFKTIYQSIDTEDRERICTYFEEHMDSSRTRKFGWLFESFHLWIQPKLVKYF